MSFYGAIAIDGLSQRVKAPTSAYRILYSSLFSGCGALTELTRRTAEENGGHWRDEVIYTVMSVRILECCGLCRVISR